MNKPSDTAYSVAVIGGGVSGLAAAQRLNRLRPDWSVELFEAQSRLGGVLATERDTGYTIERAADNFLRGPSAPWAETLCQEIGFDGQLIPTETRNRGAHVVWQGKLHRVPAGFQLLAPGRMWPILTSSLLSVRGRLRLCAEPWIREPPGIADESLAAFATRRLGREAFQRLVQPLVAGIYVADADRLSVGAALPQMVEMVRKHGSLYRAMRQRAASEASRPSPTSATKDHQASSAQVDGATRQTRGARYSLFVAPRGGMSDFVAALASSLDKTVVHRGTSVHKLERLATGRWRVESLANDSTTDERSAEFDAVVLALPSNHAARLLEPVHATLAAELAAIPLASSAVVCLGVDQADIARPLDAFGCVVPAAENRPVLAISYSSLKFPGRAPAGKLLLRVFVGGALQPGLADLPDEPLGQLALEQTRAILGYSGTPHLRMIVRWPQAMPQYHVGHLARVARIERLVTELPCLQLAGNSMHGVGIPQCVRTARKAAEGLIEQLVGTSSHASPAQQEHPSP